MHTHIYTYMYIYTCITWIQYEDLQNDRTFFLREVYLCRCLANETRQVWCLRIAATDNSQTNR